MVDSLKPYPAYKNSGVPWLGSMPEHWEICSLASLTSAISQRGRPDLPLLSVVREKGVIPRSSMSDEENRNFVPDDLGNYKAVREGNLVINKMKAWQGSLGIAPMDGIVSPAYFVFDLRMSDRRFGQALLRSKTYVGFFAQASDGVRIGQWDLSIHGMKRIPVVVPPFPEQYGIVRFLGHMERRIRRYIQAKQKLIKLLEEQKQAIIHRAVTRGLDRSVRLKPSGVEWLGDVPEHWHIAKIKRVARINPPRTASSYLRASNDYVVFLPMELITAQGEVDTSERRPVRDVWHGFTHFQRGDVVLAKITPCFENGKGACLNGLPTEIGFGTTELIVLRAGPKVVAEFLYWLTSLAQFRRLGVESMTGSAGQQRVSPGFVGNFVVPVPPLDEQKDIVTHIRTATQHSVSAIHRAKREISLLREYRARLVADVVTGKLDVREAAARLSDEAENLSPLDEMEAGEDNGEVVECGDLDSSLEEAEA